MLSRWHSAQGLSLRMPGCLRRRLGGCGVPPVCVLAVAGRNKVSDSWLWLCSGNGFMPSFCSHVGYAKNVLLLPIYCCMLLEIFYWNHTEKRFRFHFPARSASMRMWAEAREFIVLVKMQLYRKERQGSNRQNLKLSSSPTERWITSVFVFGEDQVTLWGVWWL